MPVELPFRQKPFVADGSDDFLDRMETLDEALPAEANCPNGHTLGLTRQSLDWPAKEGVYLLGPTPVYADAECRTTFIPAAVLQIAEVALRTSVKSPETYEFVLPAGASPLK